MSAKEDRRARWDTWRHITTLRVYEAVGLSLGIDPERIRPHPQGWMVGDGRMHFDEGTDFDSRLLIAIRNVGASGALATLTTPGDTACASVSLPVFVQWAMSLGWTLPAELTDIVSEAVMDAPSEPAETRLPRKGRNRPKARFPNRARFVSELMDQERITASGLRKKVELDPKTVGKILNGLEVRRMSLVKLAGGLGIQVADIPED